MEQSMGSTRIGARRRGLAAMTLVLSTTAAVQFVSGAPSDSHICMDGFGYRPNAEKVAVFRRPLVGYDAPDLYSPGRMASEELLLVLEEGVLNVSLSKGGVPVRIRLPPFTLILATTQPSALSAPLIQRPGLQFRFGFYSNEELRTIILNATARMDVEFDDEVCIDLARRARSPPRASTETSPTTLISNQETS